MIKLRIVLLSFLMLFLELALIRWIPAFIRPVGYFSNLILLGAFLGMGLGLIKSSYKRSWFTWFPACFLALLCLVAYLRVDVFVDSPQALFFQAVRTNEALPSVSLHIILPIIFLAVTGIFSIIANAFGKYFNETEPLIAYSADIVGSIAGIGIFSILAFIGTPAWTWFMVIGITTMFILILDRPPTQILLLNMLLLIGSLILSFSQSIGTLWSPYYKVTVSHDIGGYAINVNNLGHQFMQRHQDMQSFYATIYNAFPNESFDSMLIIGAGSGNDVAVALAKNPKVTHIDAVDIDPVIQSLGKKLHPDAPYDNPKVQVITNDGRNFLERTNKKYDVIIFALTDSLTLTSQMSSVRLESFLYTKESFTRAKNHLTTDGVLVLYNYYREPWLFEKLAGMLLDVFHMPVYATVYGDTGMAATLLAGPRTTRLTTSTVVSPVVPQTRITGATDNWPFIYLREPSIPTLYKELIGILLGITLISVILTIGKAKLHYFDIRLFLFGMAFLLLETKNLVTFELLFGTTWYVNALVFAAVLLSVLLANLISIRYTIRRQWILYTLLFLSLALSGTIRTTTFFAFPIWLRYGLASCLYFLPIGIANLIFSQAFKRAKYPTISLGSNLIGAVIGGLLEYSALAFGYDAISIIIVLLYTLTLFLGV